MAAAQPIVPIRYNGMGFPPVEHLLEDDAETFLRGAPVTINGDGHAIEVPDEFGGSELIYGFAAENAHNLAAAGTAELGNEHGSPQNQSSAKTTAIGSPLKTGYVAVHRATAETHWRIALVDGQTFTQTLVEAATRYHLDKAANGYWCVDSTDTGTDAKHAVHIRGVDPNNSAFVICKLASAAIAG
jgi:hypothetical protein